MRFLLYYLIKLVVKVDCKKLKESSPFPGIITLCGYAIYENSITFTLNYLLIENGMGLEVYKWLREEEAPQNMLWEWKEIALHLS